MVGTTISHYQVLRCLGAGGMGEVYLARDKRLDREVALKVLPPTLAQDPVRRQRFLTEARAASALTHPNACVIHEVGEAPEGRFYLVMEYVPGRTLDALIAEGAIDLQRALTIALQAADALEVAHSKGIVHRDIKPSNIIWTDRGQAKVLDFGLAKRLAVDAAADPDADTQVLTQTGQVLGTPKYMSPEQALGQAVDHRTDIFSLGVVLYELITRRCPFAGSTFGDTLNRIMNAAPEPMSTFATGVPPELERIVNRCLEKPLEHRYPSARTLIEDLRHLERGLSTTAQEPIALRPEPLSAPASPSVVAQAGLSGATAVAPPSGALVPPAPVAGLLTSASALKGSDVFITYAPIDDRPNLGAHEGWVSQFYRNLELRIEQLSGEPVKVWRHPGAPGQSEADQGILQSLPDVRALVSVLSPPFIKSDACRREVEEFCQAAQRAGRLRVDSRSRIFKVIKTPVDPKEMPATLSGVFQSLMGFEFFEVDAQSGRLREYSEEFGDESRRVFLEKVYDLAHEIHQVLKACRQEETKGAPAAPAASTAKVIYLAETTSDLRAERDRMRRELLERGYVVVPEQPLPFVADELVAAVTGQMRQAQVVIHLVGSRFGLVPEGANESLVELQVRLSGEVTTPGRLGRYIWTPPGLGSDDQRQQQFLRGLQEGRFGMDGTELLCGTVEQLKGLVLKRLTTPRPEPKPVPAAAAGGTVPRIYLVCDRADEAAVEPIEDYLYDCGFEVNVPIFDGDEEQFVEIHQENLKLCDAVLIYFGHASAQWVEMKLMDLVKAPGYGRVKPWLGQAVYLAPPDHRRKQRFRSHTAEVIREEQCFNRALLDGFVQRLRTARDATPAGPAGSANTPTPPR
jgi:serine/threonine protein kinase